MTRGNQRDKDRARAQARAAKVRFPSRSVCVLLAVCRLRWFLALFVQCECVSACVRIPLRCIMQ